MLLPSAGWAIYSMASYEEVYSYLLRGWCAFEYYAAHGTSPYITLSTTNADGVDSNSPPQAVTDEADRIANALYDARTDTCLSPSQLQ